MSCGAGGSDVIAFMMRYRNLSFKEACQMLGAWEE